MDRKGNIRRGIVTTNLSWLKGISDNYKSYPVEILSLDSFINKLDHIKIWDFVKIDCEGAEFEILNSLSRKNFDKIKRISMETHAGYPESEFITLLEAMGFKLLYHERIDYGVAAIHARGFIKAVKDS